MADYHLTIHVLPVGDVFPHTESVGCLCQPTVEYDPLTMAAPLVTHHAWDGREQQERTIPTVETTGHA